MRLVKVLTATGTPDGELTILPWNPNRLGTAFWTYSPHRSDRSVSPMESGSRGTREGAVYQRLLKKLETERSALKGTSL